MSNMRNVKMNWESPKTCYQEFAPQEYVALCSFTATFKCQIYGDTTGRYGTSHNGHYYGKKDGQEHAIACQQTIVTYWSDRDECIGIETLPDGSTKSPVPLQTPTFGAGEKAPGLYVMWRNTDKDGSPGEYIHEGIILTYEKDENLS